MKTPESFDKSLFESVFKHATMGILVTDQKGKIILVNQFVADNFGYKRDELLGKVTEDLIPQRFHHSHKGEREKYYGQATTREMGAGRDLYGLKKDGTEFPVEVSLSPVKTEAGLFIISFIVDISVRKEKELAERRYQKKINQIFHSLSKEKELNEMKSRFVSMASHEFRTPLSTILSSASLINKYKLEEDQSKREKHIERIKSSVKTLTGVLNEFLSIGRLEEGRTEARYLYFDLQGLISSVCDEMQDVRKTGQQIEYVHEGEREVRLDLELLRSIVINLLSNAIKFSAEGSTIRVNSRKEEEKITIHIADNGFGISENDQKHLFERFFRGDNVLNIQGTGLGLHIVGRYVELMKGTIACDSHLGKGTTFKLNFNE